MKKLLTALVALTISVSALAVPLTPEDLFSDDRITEFAISPTGEYIAYVAPQDDTEILTIAKVDGMKPTFTTKMGSKRYVGRLRWVNDERIMLWPAERYGAHEVKYLTGEIQALNYNGKRNTKLWGYRVNVKPGKQDPRGGYLGIASTLKDDPDHIMITTIDGGYGRYATRRLRKMNIYNGRINIGERSNVRSASFLVDRQGNSLMQWGVDEEYENIVTYKDKSGEWQTLPDAKNYLNAWNSSNEQNVILKRDAGDNVYELVQFNRLNKKITTLATTTNINMSPILDRDGNIIGYNTEKFGKPVRVYFDEQSKEAQLRRLIAKTFKNTMTSVSNGSEDGSRRMVTVWSDQEPSKYYLYDANAKTKLRLLTAFKRTIKRDRFSKMTPIAFEARDGLNIQGYISRPNGSKGNDPMVVMVHGGPYGPRDYWGWDAEVQLLTSQGYAVLQVNFRGSGGYGEAFEESGHLQWGKAMQDDLTDGTLWAVEQGYANKDKLCIYGGSYGGYAALMAVVKEPELYKCAIGYVGVYDLPLERDVGDIKSTVEGRHFLDTTRGKENDPDLVKYSPARQASKIKAGIFLIHGEQDNRVPIEHFEAMTEALDNAKHPYEKLVAQGEGHGFAENKNQYKLYGQMVEFLAKYLK
jgi:dienelactone hydrolase